jgi:hypothetical protein
MTTYGGTETKKVPGARATLTIAANTYAAIEDYDFSEEYEKMRDPVGGTNAPFLTAGSFIGEFNCDLIYTTDAPVAWMTLTSGDLPATTITCPLQDTQASPTTKTMTILNAKTFKWGMQKRRGSLVRMTISASYPVAGIIS